MFAAVDLGSNSFRLHIGSYEGGAIRVIKSARDPIRLAAGLDQHGNLTVEAMQRALACLAHFKEILLILYASQKMRLSFCQQRKLLLACR